MKVKELIEKLNEYNQDADVEICVNGMSQEFEICYGGSEGCTKSSCNCVALNFSNYELRELVKN